MKEFISYLGKSSLNQIISLSYYPLLFTSTICLILYGGGFKKLGKYVPATIIIYFLLQCIRISVQWKV